MTTGGKWNFQVDGRALDAEVFAADDPRGAILVAHGYGEHHRRYGEQIDMYVGAGFTVFTYDHRGHGGSPGQRAVVDVRQLVDDHRKARREVRKAIGELPLICAGHSMGGLITAASVLADPEGVTAVLLSSPALLVGADQPGIVKTVGAFVSRFLPALPTVPLDVDGMSRIQEARDRYEADPKVHHGRVPARSAATMIAVGDETRAACASFAVPALLIHGDADSIADIDGSREFAERAGTSLDPRPEIRLVEYAGGYHELFNDLCADEVRADVLAWLDERVR